MKRYIVYCLVKNGRPYYVGVTTKRRLRLRLKEHKAAKKDFDTHLILKDYKTKKEAFLAENAIIKLHSVFDINLVNAKLPIDEYIGLKFKVNNINPPTND